MFPKVLDASSSQSKISKAATSSLDNTIGEAHRFASNDGGDIEWSSMSVPKVLDYLIAESPNFKLAMHDLLRCAGAHGSIDIDVTCGGDRFTCGDVRIICLCLRPSPVLLATMTGATWKLILYADGVVPGNPLAADNRRKSVVWYFSFLEFGWKLQYEDVWMPIALIRTAR